MVGFRALRGGGGGWEQGPTALPYYCLNCHLGANTPESTTECYNPSAIGTNICVSWESNIDTIGQ